MIDDQLLVGIVLIAVGVAIGLLAYALVLNRREAAQSVEAESSSEAEGRAETEMESQAEPGQALEQVEGELEEDEPPEAPEFVRQDETAREPALTAGAPSLDEPRNAVAGERIGESGEEAAPLAPGGRRVIATLTRDGRTGRLALIVGDHEYANPWELKGTNDWAGIEQASMDLTNWLSEAQPPESGSPSRGQRLPPKTKSLVDEVNEILERKLAETGLTNRGVRLSEDREGSVRVYIGLQGYTMDEIPDAEIREVIRQAVAEWEAR